jgi:cytochrome P450
VRSYYRDAQAFIVPEVAKRRQILLDAAARGEKHPKDLPQDTIAWMLDLQAKTPGAKDGDVDFVAAQLMLSLAAISTTSEVQTHAVFELCEHPEFVAPLREEIISVVREEEAAGRKKSVWSKNMLFKLKFMDSFLKEVLRLHPSTFGKLFILSLTYFYSLT